MSYSKPGNRIQQVATKEVVHGKIAEENGLVGPAEKIANLGPYVDPSSAEATTIAVDEAFTHVIGLECEVLDADVDGTLAVGEIVWIDPADNALYDTAAATYIPVGIVTSIDTARGTAILNPHVANSLLAASA